MPPPFQNEEFDDANSEADCDRILQEVLTEIDRRWKKRKDDWDAAQRCDERYTEELEMNDLRHKSAYGKASNTGKGILMTCLGLGSAATGVSARVGWVSVGKISLTVARVGSGVLAAITGLASLAYCKNLTNSTAQSEIDTVDAEKKLADKMSLTKRDECRRTTNYERVKRKYQNWYRYGGKRGGGRYWAIRVTNEDHPKCVEQFQNQGGDCGTTE